MHICFPGTHHYPVPNNKNDYGLDFYLNVLKHDASIQTDECHPSNQTEDCFTSRQGNDMLRKLLRAQEHENYHQVVELNRQKEENKCKLRYLFKKCYHFVSKATL